MSRALPWTCLIALLCAWVAGASAAASDPLHGPGPCKNTSLASSDPRATAQPSSGAPMWRPSQRSDDGFWSIQSGGPSRLPYDEHKPEGPRRPFGGRGHHGGRHPPGRGMHSGSIPSASASQTMQLSSSAAQSGSASRHLPGNSMHSGSIPSASASQTMQLSSSAAQSGSAHPVFSSQPLPEKLSSGTVSAAPSAISSTQESQSASSSSASSSSTPGLERHNMYRKQYGADSLTWSEDLASGATEWAASQCNGLHHATSGENIGAGTDLSIEGTVDMWMAEVNDYDYNNPGFSENTGHFTQVVWKATTEVGCGSYDCGNNWVAWVCRYSPAGNVQGAFEENVGTKEAGFCV